MKYSIGTTYEGKDFNYLKEIAPHINHVEISPDSLAVKKKWPGFDQPYIIATTKVARK